MGSHGTPYPDATCPVLPKIALIEKVSCSPRIYHRPPEAPLHLSDGPDLMSTYQPAVQNRLQLGLYRLYILPASTLFSLLPALKLNCTLRNFIFLSLRSLFIFYFCHGQRSRSLHRHRQKARDLLYKDFQTDHKVTVTTYSPTGVAITSSGSKKGELFLADVNTQLKNKNITTDIKVDTSSNLFTTVTIDEPAPGLKAIFSFRVPDQRSGKVELQYLHDYAGISTSVGLTANPIINFSGVVGTNVLALGTDVSLDTKSGTLTKCNAGFNFTNSDLIASLTLNDKGDTLSASYYHSVSPLTNTAVGAEVSHSFSTNENTITVGTQHALDPLTTVKARINNFGKASALIQHAWRPKSLFTISGEVDTKSVDKSAKFGLALALKP